MGRMGITHFSIINSHPNVEVVSVADSSPYVLDILKKLKPEVHTFKDYEECIDNSDLDAILVCTPPNISYRVIKKARSKNLHVFVEKPFVTKSKDAAELVKLFEDSNLINQVGYSNRYNDIFSYLKGMVENNLIGKVIRFKIEMFSRTIIKEAKEDGWRAFRENGGGAVFEIASHAIDLLIYLLGTPDKVAGTSLNKIFSKNVEDAVSTTFFYKNNTSGTLYVNWSDESYRKPEIKFELFGEKGKIVSDQHEIKLYLKQATEKYVQGWNKIYITDVFKPVPFYVRGNEFTSQLYKFVDQMIAKRVDNKCTFKEGLKTLNVIENIFSDFEANGGFK